MLKKYLQQTYPFAYFDIVIRSGRIYVRYHVFERKKENLRMNGLHDELSIVYLKFRTSYGLPKVRFLTDIFIFADINRSLIMFVEKFFHFRHQIRVDIEHQ